MLKSLILLSCLEEVGIFISLARVRNSSPSHYVPIIIINSRKVPDTLTSISTVLLQAGNPSLNNELASSLCRMSSKEGLGIIAGSFLESNSAFKMKIAYKISFERAFLTRSENFAVSTIQAKVRSPVS